MLKRAMLALAFVGSLGLASSANAYYGHRGGGGWYGGGPYPHSRSYYAAYGPSYSAYGHRFDGWGGRRHHDRYRGLSSGVSLYIGF